MSMTAPGAKRAWWDLRRLPAPAPLPPPPQHGEAPSKPYFETPIYEVLLQRYPWLISLMLIQARAPPTPRRHPRTEGT